MNLNKKFFTLLCLLSLTVSSVSAVSNKGFRADMSFADFEELSNLFKPHHKQSVFKINHDNSPIKILRAGVRDQGTVFFKGLSGARNTYRIEVENVSQKEILAYQVTWILKHPFEDYVFHKIKVNSIKPLGVGEKQKLQFRRNKHYRDDAYYYVEISKVEYADDEMIWEAPEIEKYKTHTQMDDVKRQIDEMEEDKGLEGLSEEEIQALKEKYANPTNEMDNPGTRVIEFDNSKQMVELKEIEETSTVKETVPSTKTSETKTKTVETQEEIITTKEVIIEEGGYTLEDEQAELKIDEDDFEELLEDIDSLLERNKDGIVDIQSSNVIEKKVIQETPVPSFVTEEKTVVEEKEVEKTTPVVETTTPVKTVTQTTTSTKTTNTAVVEEDDDDDLDDEDFDDDEDWDEDDDFDFDDEIDFGDDEDFDDF
jgi:hypothetical protein